MIVIPLWQRITVVLVSLLAFLMCVPNMLSPQQLTHLPAWVENARLSLGLDLQGGSHLLLEVDTDAVVKERADGIVDGLRTAFRQERPPIFAEFGVIGGAQSPVVFVRLRDQAQRDRALAIARTIAELNSSGAFGLGGAQTITVETADDGTIRLPLPTGLVRSWRLSAIGQSVEIVRRRVDESGTKEPLIQVQGTDRIILELPGLSDPEQVKRLLGKTAKLQFRFVAAGGESGETPAGSERLVSEEPGEPPLAIERRVIVAGDDLVDAQAGFTEGISVVNFRFNGAGAKKFAEATRTNVGRRFAIVLDNKVISAPVIREPILGGSGQISGSFTTQSASELSTVLRAGALPAPLKVIEQRSVGPGLGADSIRAGMIACVAGLILIIAVMVIFYGLFGVFAVVGLIVNLVLLVAAMSMFGATLSLPGIAGIVLSMGMAVDANVLIYERMREEVRAGRTTVSAIDAGFARAFGTILDSNLTTVIAALLLIWLGSGPVKGFAVTLTIGVIASMFTAIMLTRLLVVIWLRARRRDRLPI